MTPTFAHAPIHESETSLAGASRAMTVERFDPDAPGTPPAVVLLHGADGLRYRGPVYRAMARHMAGQGLRVLLPHYFERTGTQGHASAARPMDFLGWMDAIDSAVGAAGPGPVGLVGISLGAYLALAVAGRDERIGAVVACCGGLPAILAGGFTRMPPVLILHGEDDRVVPVSEARALEAWLRERGTAHEVVIYPGQGHNIEGAAAEDALKRMTAFLRRHLVASM
jgi:carboxymethylenebutenolidase